MRLTFSRQPAGRQSTKTLNCFNYCNNITQTMNTDNIHCVCNSIFHGLTRRLPHPSDPQGGCLSFTQFIQRRNRTIDAINQLNCTLIPSLDIRPSSTARLAAYTRVENNRPIRSCVSRECQTDLTGEVRPTGANWSEEGAICRPVTHQVNQKKFLCSLCGLEYKWRSSVYRHVKNDHQVNQEVCEYCYVPFTNKTLLYSHLQQRQERGWCRASRGIENTGNEAVVPTPVGFGMPALYASIDLWRGNGQPIPE